MCATNLELDNTTNIMCKNCSTLDLEKRWGGEVGVYSATVYKA